MIDTKNKATKTVVSMILGVMVGSSATYLLLDQKTGMNNTQSIIQDSLIDQTIQDFELPALMGDNTERNVKLSEYEDKWKLLFFYPEDGTTVCPTELRALLAQKDIFDELNVEVLPISVDSIARHKEWKPNLSTENFDFTWLSDTDGKLAQYLGIYDAETKVAFRGTFLVSPEGQIRSEITYNNDIARSNDEIIRMIQQNQLVEETGGVCPAGWEDGDETIEAIPEYEITEE